MVSSFLCGPRALLLSLAVYVSPCHYKRVEALLFSLSAKTKRLLLDN